jgi:hypothetical protein
VISLSARRLGDQAGMIVGGSGMSASRINEKR